MPASNKNLRPWLAAAGMLLVAVVGYPVATRVIPGLANRLSGTGPAAGADGAASAARIPVKTRSAERPPAPPAPTHGSHQWREFYLPPVEIDGIPLADALDKLRAAYEAVCQEAGEMPLRITFSLPPGHNPVLRLKSATRTLESSVRLLAVRAKLTVQRRGKEYLFTASGEFPSGSREETLTVSPAMQSSLGLASFTAESLRDAMMEDGMALDPSTRLTLRPGGLEVETASPADLAAIKLFLSGGELDPPVQQKFTVKAIVLPPGADWQHPDSFSMDDAGTQGLFRELAQRPGCDLRTMPSVMAKPGEPTKIEIISREVMVPKPNGEEGFEMKPVGVTVDLAGQLRGLGHQMETNFTDTTATVNPATHVGMVQTRAEIADQGQIGDAATQFITQLHPDGSRTILAVTPTRIDATGRPVREQR